MPITAEQAIRSLSFYSSKSLAQFKDQIKSSCCQITGSTLSYFATIDATEHMLTMVGRPIGDDELRHDR